jgi:hypothetical protein
LTKVGFPFVVCSLKKESEMDIQYHSFKGLIVRFELHEIDIALQVLHFLQDNHESEIAKEQFQHFIDVCEEEGRVQ